ncbi:GNAT family N-acetyltransferase, partial [Rhodothalassium salexigens DSM 2132]|nr:GNAT family N-acetyltransferase [Rhodothalassium salexigens DSM 2132]
GAFLLVDALRRSLEQASTIGAAAVVVEAKDEPAARFYETYGFQRLPERPNRLFLPMTTVAKLF